MSDERFSPFEDALVAAITHESRSGCNGHVLRKWLSRVEVTNDATPADLASRKAVEDTIVARPVLLLRAPCFEDLAGGSAGDGGRAEGRGECVV